MNFNFRLDWPLFWQTAGLTSETLYSKEENKQDKS